jgi:hypothetical protein
LCDPGTFSNGSVPCTTCAIGKYAPYVGSSFCFDCPLNYYSNLSGLSTCFECPQPLNTTKIGSTSLYDCQIQQCPSWNYVLNGSAKGLDVDHYISKVSPNKNTFWQANLLCSQQLHGAHLPILDSSEVKNLEKTATGGSDAWIGAFRKGNTLYWINNITFPPIFLGLGALSNDNEIYCVDDNKGSYSVNSLCGTASFGYSCHIDSSWCFSKSCSPGTMLDISSPPFYSCIPCSMGKYQISSTKFYCNQCPAGFYQTSTGQSFCKSCPIGKYSSVVESENSSSCVDCPLGTFGNLTGMSVCSACYPGTFQNNYGRSTCNLCSLGTSSNTFSSPLCSPCSYGTFSNLFGLSKCLNCSAGYFQNALGSTFCLDCHPGYFSSQYTGFSACKGCQLGKFSAKNNTVLCDRCYQGQYADEDVLTSCKFCVGGSTLIEGAVSENDCAVCSEGYYGDPPSGTKCAICPNSDGIECPAGSKIPYVKAGFYRMGQAGASSTVILPCDPEAACLFTGNLSETVCGTGYAGVRCGEFAIGYYHYETICKSCPSEAVKWLTFIVLLIVVVFVISRFLGK